jgi:hypothetical protein
MSPLHKYEILVLLGIEIISPFLASYLEVSVLIHFQSKLYRHFRNRTMFYFASIVSLHVVVCYKVEKM